MTEKNKFEWDKAELEAMLVAADSAKDEKLSVENAAISGWQEGYIYCVLQRGGVLDEDSD